MIGHMDVSIQLLPRTGDRVDALARIVGPGETDYELPLSITRTVQAIWGLQDQDLEVALADLVHELMDTILGTASAPPSEGLWFDSYNSESTTKGTLDRIRNFGIVGFLRNSSTDQISSIFGGGLLAQIEQLSIRVLQVHSRPLVGTLDYSFERSEAEHDLATPPTDNAGFLYRICILSVIIDAMSLRAASEPKETKSLKALTNFVTALTSEADARRITEAFARVKDLRKQYPIHEHFERDLRGQKKVRDEVQAAYTFFGFNDVDDYAAMWKKVTDAFKQALKKLETILVVPDI